MLLKIVMNNIVPRFKQKTMAKSMHYLVMLLNINKDNNVIT